MLFWLMTLRKTEPLTPTTDSYAFRMSVEVQHCKPRWGLECPRRWARMLGTDDERLRVCGACGCEVRLCLSLQESGEWARLGPRFGIACAPEHFVEEVRSHRDLRREHERITEARELRRQRSGRAASGGT